MQPGTRLGPYEILAPIGAGGMGEVFKARDTRLERDVAIKVLPTDFAANADFKARFDREAKTISQLNHPNICTLYDVGDNYLVMELVDGESLADRLARGPLPISEVLRAGAQIADALARAHRAGIVHRDIKPGNIMMSKSGVKLLDFGLAKSQATLTLPDAATQHKPLTAEGTILGTFQYMAPEQLEGQDADARTDIFALGAVLYEMATGQRAFSGKTKTSLIAAIVTTDPPPISSVQPLTPPAFEHVVRKCLAKDPDDRWQSAHDVADELRWISQAGSQAGIPAPLSLKRKSRERLAWILALITVAALAAALALRRPHAEPRLTASITPPLHAPFELMNDAALSPDGTMIAFVASTNTGRFLWLRSLEQSEPRQLPSTDGARQPFWSPDSKSIGFFANDKLKRIAVAGGPPRAIADVHRPYGGGTWGTSGRIVIGSGALGPLYRVDAEGGKAEVMTKLAPTDEAHRWPQFLPDGEHVVFLADASKTEDHHIQAASVADGSVRTVMQAITQPEFVAPDTLLFVRARTLLAQRIDPKTAALRGEPQALAENIVEDDDNHHYEFTASANRLLYRSAVADVQLEWVDRSGNVVERIGEPRRLSWYRASPDAQRIALTTIDVDGRGDDIWMIDRARSVNTRLTFDPAGDITPLWSPDGSHIVFSSLRSNMGDLYEIDVANPAPVERLTNTPDQLLPRAWTRDGKTIVAEAYHRSNIDLVTYSMDKHEVRPYIASTFPERNPALSPDDQWIGYESGESGRSEVYVERFPTHANRRQISNSGGVLPQWRPDGRELYYAGPGGMLMSVDATNANSAPKPLFRLPGFGYQPSPDGKLFLIDRPVDDVTKVPLTFVTNWR